MKLSRFAAAVGTATLVACAGADNSVTAPVLGTSTRSATTGSSGKPGTGDTTVTNPTGEWRLATIHGLLLGYDPSRTSGDTLGTSTPVANARVELHKYSLQTSASSDSGSTALRDLGVVATLTTDASGRFNYVLSDPIVVKSGQAPPTVTYKVNVTPPPGSPYAAAQALQVFFAEQLTGDGTWRLYLYPPKR